VGFFLILLILFVVVWVLVLMPTRRRRMQHAAMQDAIEVGDEVITAGGLHGKIVEATDETARIEIAPSVVVTLDRRAIAAVAREIEVEAEPEAEPDAEAPEPETAREPR
jgi:preprotein translocase subunit YajC